MTEPGPQPQPVTIGVFDSGFGGLTVLRALLDRLPGARYLYLGDTARLPYGSKSRETVARCAISAVRFLLAQGADLLVVACNTATALALQDIKDAAAPVPVFGVIQPGADAALLSIRPGAQSMLPPASQTASVLVLATAATVHSHAYLRALEVHGLEATEQACPLLVPLVEEGWLANATHADPTREAVTQEVLRIYLAEALAAAPRAETLLLGCTHYPLLRLEMTQVLADLNRPLRIIDSAEATADAVVAHLTSLPTGLPPGCTFYATDSVEKFRRLGPHFLGGPLPEVHLIDLGE